MKDSLWQGSVRCFWKVKSEFESTCLLDCLRTFPSDWARLCRTLNLMLISSTFQLWRMLKFISQGTNSNIDKQVDATDVFIYGKILDLLSLVYGEIWGGCPPKLWFTYDSWNFIITENKWRKRRTECLVLFLFLNVEKTWWINCREC